MPIQLDKKEVLRYLGYRKTHILSQEIEQIIDDTMLEVQRIAQPRYSFLIFPGKLNHEARTIELEGAKLNLSGDAIYRHLKKSEKIVLLAATLGIGVERQLQRYELSDLTRAFVLDACCTELIERICDFATCDIEQEIKKEGFTLTRRFSPGYGDLPLSIQAEFLSVLKADKKLGINLSPTSIMMPRKSVTAIIGLKKDSEGRETEAKSKSCSFCSMAKECNYRIEV